jgi:inner membrane protein
MASLLSHPAVPLALGLALGADVVPPGLLALAVACSLLPDLDAIGFWLGVPYGHPLGHRGLTHSLAFGAALAVAGTLIAPGIGADPWTAFPVLFISAASHGLLDALTTGGLGIAFFSPFSNRRYFLPWRILEVSPIGLSALFSRRGVRVLGSELRYVWAPCLLLAAMGLLFGRP